jgi:CubicO group peptidase (beta-lactamase class C family)
LDYFLHCCEKTWLGLLPGLPFFVASLVFLPAHGKSPAREPGGEFACYFALSEAEEAAQAAITAHRASAVSFAFVQGERFVQTGVFGFKDLAGEEPTIRPLAATLDTEFGIGQTARILTTLAVMKLVEQGRVRLDDPVVMHVPSFEMKSPFFRDISVRMLLGHASGLPGTDWRNLYTTWPFPGYPSQVLDTVSRQHLKHDPGALRTPCNDGFTLAERVVANVSGRPFTDFVKKELLEPLGMTRCGYPTTYNPQYPCARVFHGPARQPQDFANGHGTGGFYAAPEEMAKLIKMILDQGRVKDRQLFAAASIREMGLAAFPQAFDPLPSPCTANGLGWDSVQHPSLDAAGVAAWSIRGDTPHSGSAMIVVPREAMGIFVAGAGGFTGEEAMALAECTLLRALERSGRIKTMPGTPEPEAGAEESGAGTQVPRLVGLYASCEGAYRVSEGKRSGMVEVERFDLERGAWVPLAQGLKLRPDGWFIADSEPGGAFFLGKADGRHYLARRWASRYSMNRIILGERVTGVTPLAPFWAALKGRRWLLVNEPLDGGLFDASARLEFLTLPGEEKVLFLNGFRFQPVDTSRGPEAGEMILRIPGPGGRDLEEPRPLPLEGELWMQCGSRVYRPLESAPTLGANQNRLSFGDGGHVLWRRVPPSSVLILEGVVAWKLFDGRFKALQSGQGPGTVQAPGGECYVAVQGNPGAQGTVRVLSP